MHIEWLAHPYNPALNGTKEHVSRSVAENAVHFKQAEILPRPNYGTKEWVEERQAADAARGTPVGDTSVPNIDGVRWSLKDHPLAGWVILRETGTEQVRFSDSKIALLYGCPKKLAAEYNKIVTAQSEHAAKLDEIAQGNSWGDRRIKF
jgi:hypothetical protein